jgi:hypothetical protein
LLADAGRSLGVGRDEHGILRAARPHMKQVWQSAFRAMVGAA